MFVYRDRPVHPDATANPKMTFSNLKYFIHVMPQVLTILFLFPTPIKMKNVSFLQELIKLPRHNYNCRFVVTIREFEIWFQHNIFFQGVLHYYMNGIL